VFLLYIRCCAIDPADPAVFGNLAFTKHNEQILTAKTARGAALAPALSNPSPRIRPGDTDQESRIQYVKQVRIGWSTPRSLYSFAGLSRVFCSWLVSDDYCFDKSKLQQPVAEDDILFCTLCNAEVSLKPQTSVLQIPLPRDLKQDFLPPMFSVIDMATCNVPEKNWFNS
jgi:palmitoyltransferase